ncbi:hypothetical protein LLG95_12065 [bacterium]|nr:hypothetical protein [bacterium]
MIPFGGHFVVPDRISRLADPEHEDWHRRSLQMIFEIIPHQYCFIDSTQSPDYFTNMEAGSIFAQSLVQQFETNLKFMGSSLFNRYIIRLGDLQKFPDWILHFTEPILIWFCNPRNLQTPSVFNGIRENLCYFVPQHITGSTIYFWDSPEMELLSIENIDISPLLRHGWTEKNPSSGKVHLPWLGQIFNSCK